MSPEDKALAEWMTAELFTEDGYFAPERVGEEFLVYFTPVDAVLFNYLMDGYRPNAPTWSCRVNEPPSAALFRHLADFTKEFPASWYLINDDDDACSNLQFLWPARISNSWQHSLAEMQARPAMQGGLCRQGLVFHDRTAFLEFRYRPGKYFEIYFFGQPERHAQLVQYLSE